MAEQIEKRKRILSGIQPTGTPTLGNYIGAVRNWALLQSDYDCLYMVADLHALTVRQTPANLRRQTREMAALLLAVGIDPEQHVLFVQSHVPAHCELSWVLACNTQFGELSRMTQFKDKSAKHPDNVNGGLWRPTSWFITRIWCPLARTRPSTWKLPARLPTVSTAFTVIPLPCPPVTFPRQAPRS